MTGIVLAAAFALATPRPSPSPVVTAAYYDELHLPAEVGDRHAELRSAIGAVLGERAVIAEHDFPGTPMYTRETACKSLGVRHLVLVSGSVLTAISGPRPGSKSFELWAWIWDCRDGRVAASVSARSAEYNGAGAATLRTMYRELSASLLERVRKGLAEPPDIAVP